jgi:hypothetical protein
MAPTGSAVMRATERIPDPLGIAGVASVNISERCIFVRCSDLASGYQRMFWKQAFRALQSAEQSGWSSHSTVWASTPSKLLYRHAPGVKGAKAPRELTSFRPKTRLQCPGPTCSALMSPAASLTSAADPESNASERSLTFLPR